MEKTTRSLKYHSRRVLGQLSACQKGYGLPLDEIDQKHATVLIRRGWARRAETIAGPTYFATTSGREAWAEGLKPVQ